MTACMYRTTSDRVVCDDCAYADEIEAEMTAAELDEYRAIYASPVRCDRCDSTSA